VFVYLYPVTVKTAEPIGPKFSKFQKFASNKIRFSLNFENPRIFLSHPRTFLFVSFSNVNKQKMFTIEIEDGCSSIVKIKL